MDLTTFLAIKDRMEELGMVTDKGVQLPGFGALMHSSLRRGGRFFGFVRCEGAGAGG